jgi:hypothetical protein
VSDRTRTIALVPFAAAIVTAFTAAVLFHSTIRLGRARRLGVLGVVLAVMLLTPLIVPSNRPFLRWLSSVAAVALASKVYDLHIGANLGHRPDFWTYVWLLPNITIIVLRKLDDEPRPARLDDVIQLARCLALSTAGALLFAGTYFVDWRSWPFLVEHCVKVTAFFLLLVPAGAVASSAVRLLSGKAREMMHNPFAARTPADFWLRYNRPAQQFFYEDVFKFLGGRRAFLRATLATFAVSAIIHEYVFDIAVMRFQGYQTAFFLIQGMAVAATIRVRPKGWSALAWVAVTFAFNLVTGVLFFASINELVPFYSRPVPLW